MSDVALTINNLRIEVAGNVADIVDDVNLTIAPGEVLGLVGESGSGKTTVGLAVLGHARRGVKLAEARCRSVKHRCLHWATLRCVTLGAGW
jgi:peptide/nickel transport system ATP-binding protein